MTGPKCHYVLRLRNIALNNTVNIFKGSILCLSVSMQIKQVSTCTNDMPNYRKIKGLSQKIKPLMKLFCGFTAMRDQGLDNQKLGQPACCS